MKTSGLRILTAAGALLLASAATATAADLTTGMPLSANPILYVNNQIGLDAIGQDLSYLEPGLDAPHASNNGWQPGIQFTGSAMGSLGALTNAYIMGQFSWTKGNIGYVGSTWDNPRYGSLVNTDGTETKDFDFRLGKGFEVGPSWMFTPYFGVGYHVWDHSLSGPTGYHERYEHSYAGGGLMIQWAPTNQWVLSANGLVGSTFSPQMSTNLNGNIPMTASHLGPKVMWKAGLSADYALTPQWHVNSGFDYTHFNYGTASNAIIVANPNDPTDLYLLQEPNSRSGVWNVKAGFGYSFYQPTSRY